MTNRISIFMEPRTAAQKRQREFDRAGAYKANEAKDILMRIEDDLREAGFARKADSLSTIIGRLEVWQNTRP